MAARMWTKPLFMTKFPGDDVSTSVRRSLGAMDLGNPALKKLCDAADEGGLKYESPIYFNDCYAHFGIPSKRVAVFMRQSLDTAQFNRIKRQWEASSIGKNWVLMFTTTRQIEGLTVAELVKNLESQIGGKR